VFNKEVAIMKAATFGRHALVLVGLSFGAACNQPPQPSETEPLNVQPATLQEANETVARITHLQEANPQDARALDAIKRMQPRLDELNHLVARVELEPGHRVSFYETEPGVIGITETGLAGQVKILTNEDMANDPVALFQKLANASPAPQTLLDAVKRQTDTALPADDPRVTAGPAGPVTAPWTPPASAPASDGIQTTTSALTSGDGQWFAQNGCFHTGDYHLCMPNVSGNVYADFNTKTSFWTIAPYAGATVYVQLQYNNTQQGFLDPVFVGQWQSFVWHSGWHWACCGICACATKDYDVKRHRWDLINGINSQFHWSFAAKWNCDYYSTCDTWPN
jgi:hypothetical protein